MLMMLQWPLPWRRCKRRSGTDEARRGLWLDTTDDCRHTTLRQDGVQHSISAVTEDQLFCLRATGCQRWRRQWRYCRIVSPSCRTQSWETSATTTQAGQLQTYRIYTAWASYMLLLVVALAVVAHWTAFTITGLKQTYHDSRFIFLVRFIFHFSVCPCGGLSWLHVSFLLHVKYTISYRIPIVCGDYNVLSSINSYRDSCVSTFEKKSFKNSHKLG